jgi:hypothetical protein
MDHKRSKQRRAENEVVFKQHNMRIKQQISKVMPDSNKSSFRVGFVCECSDETCREKVEMTLAQFQKCSKSSKYFVLKPGHEQSDLERVIETSSSYSVVEKFNLPPTTDGKLNNTQALGPSL